MPRFSCTVPKFSTLTRSAPQVRLRPDQVRQDFVLPRRQPSCDALALLLGLLGAFTLALNKQGRFKARHSIPCDDLSPQWPRLVLGPTWKGDWMWTLTGEGRRDAIPQLYLPPARTLFRAMRLHVCGTLNAMNSFLIDPIFVLELSESLSSRLLSETLSCVVNTYSVLCLFPFHFSAHFTSSSLQSLSILAH